MEKTASRGFFYPNCRKVFGIFIIIGDLNMELYELKTPFEMIGKDWMLISAEKDGIVNTMTASWGGMGVIWNKNVAFVFIRPSRYTKEFIDNSEKFSLSFFDEGFRDKLTYLGRVSGRDENKIEKSGLTVASFDGVPGFSEAETTIVCKKLYAQDMAEASFISHEFFEKMFPVGDLHTMYIAEIESIHKK